MITVERESCGSRITARAFFSGKDICVLVSGGNSPHIGSVSVAIPRKSLTGDGSGSATVSTFNVTGHKDDMVGNMFALRLSAEFSCTVSVSCGIHYRELNQNSLNTILADAGNLADNLIASLKMHILKNQQRMA